jgi:enamine deaminase RidA (YjgF/YER057c/UK114 family)
MEEFKREVIASPLAPAAIGPYSQAIRAGGMLYVSGCIGMCHVEKKLVSGGVEVEARKVLDNMRNILEAGGSRSIARILIKCYTYSYIYYSSNFLFYTEQSWSCCKMHYSADKHFR